LILRLEDWLTCCSKRKTDAVLATNISHFGTDTVGDVKQSLAKQKIRVRI
jgi:imidazole glycerol phosphate synthase subunit HisF